MKKKGEAENIGGDDYISAWETDSKNPQKDAVRLVVDIVNSSDFQMKSVFVREDAEWDYFGGLMFKTVDEVKKNVKEMEAVTPVRYIEVSGSMFGKQAKLRLDWDKSGIAIVVTHHKDCPVDDFIEGLRI